MNKALAFIMAALALSVFVVGCTSQTAPAGSTATPSAAATGATATPEAQTDSAASQAVIPQNDDVQIGSLV